jgi:hypothetical protein
MARKKTSKPARIPEMSATTDIPPAAPATTTPETPAPETLTETLSSEAPTSATPEASEMDAAATSRVDANGVASGTDFAGTETLNVRWTSLPSAASRTKKPAKGKIARGNTAAKPKAAKSKATKGSTESGPAEKKLSALVAAAKVLQETGRPMNCQELIADMAAKGYWTSPAGKTPEATLYAAMTREIKVKGGQARFQKAARGQFAYQAPSAS